MALMLLSRPAGRRLLGASLLTVLAACGGGSPGANTPATTTTGSTPTTGGPATGSNRCTTPAAAEVLQRVVTSPVPTSLDPGRVASINATTQFHVSVYLPERCPGDTFPVVMESHGYSGARETNLRDNSDVPPDDPHFPSLDTFLTGLPHEGYVVVSFDERGHGDSTPDNGGGYARGIDPEAETQDAIALLDYLHDNRAEFFIIDQTPDSGIAKDIPIGLIGGSYGGAYQMVLAALDERIDTIVPNGTWHNLLHSLMPGDAMKLSFAGLLCLLADQGGVVNSPVFAETCNAVSYDEPQARNRRTRQDLADTLAPLNITEAEVIELFGTHGMNFLQKQQAAGQPALSTGGPAFELRSLPTMFLQGNRDVLFNMTEAYWNRQYFRSAAAAGVPIKFLTTEGTHMNPLAGQVETPANCGPIIGIDLIRSWFDFHLKGMDTATYQSIPDVCISVTDSIEPHNATPVSVTLADIPVGSQSGTGAVPALLASATDTVSDLPGTGPTFVPVVTISGANKVLAGIPTIESMTVTEVGNTNPLLPDVTAVAFIGVGIQRSGQLILVDDQVGAFLEGTHTFNRNVDNSIVMLPGVGEQLQDGDVVGLLMYENHIQYSAIIDASTAPGSTGLSGTVTGVQLPPLLAPTTPAFQALQHENPYQVQFTNIGLPIFDVTQFAGATLNQ